MACFSGSMANFKRHTPYLLTACNCKHNGKDNRRFTLYSIQDQLLFEFDEPLLHEKIFIGSQYDWLCVLDRHCEPSLVNPLTGESIPLPSITTLPTVRPCYSISNDMAVYICRPDFRPNSRFLHCTFVDHLDQVAFKKVLVSSNPSLSSGNLAAAALVGLISDLVVTRPRESRWNVLQGDWFMDIMFRQNGKLVASTDKGAIYEVDFEGDDFVITQTSAPFLKDYSVFNLYLAEDCAGRILMIHRTHDYIDVPETNKVTVFKLVGSYGEETEWKQVKSLDGEAIFVGANAAVSLAKEDIHGDVKANTLYFTDEWWDYAGGDEGRGRLRDICAYNLTNNSVEQCCPYEYRQRSWPLPVWIHLSNSN